MARCRGASIRDYNWKDRVLPDIHIRVTSEEERVARK
jgi:hypothetical protein